MNQLWNIDFESLRFSVGGWHDGKRRKKKEVLKGINGEFRGCELTGIVGPSGSGKTSMMNILSGYTRKDVSGIVRMNGKENIAAIRKKSKYIMQDYSLHHFITVREAMKFSANLKLIGVSETCKNCKIMSILENLRLTDRSNSYTGVLSGGEQKRLSIALELVDDPAILFLDEPTTGLDSSSSRQCIQLLQRLATEGKTIVCTIHSTSPLLFDMFNHIYALADGSCIYQGSSNNLVPFLNELDLICPSTYNPADFLLEIADNDYGQLNNRLTEKIQNGSNNEFRSVQDTQQTMHKFTHELYCPNDTSHRFTHQLKQLLIRNILITTRDKTLTLMRLMIHLVLAIFIGIMYKGIGDDASNIFNIYKLLFFNIFLLMFTAFLSLQTTFPLDLPIVRREHFNEWYSTTAYYFALNIADIPIVIATNFVYIVITYFMTNQPAEPYRFGAYYVTILLLSFSAQGLGLIAGSMLNVKFTLILGAYFICPFVLFSNFFVQVKDVDPIWNWCFQGSFIKHAFEGSMLSIFGFDREKMSCDADYCMYRWPQKFLDSVGISDSFPNVTIKLIAFVFVFRVVAFIIMWCRLRHQK